MHVGPIACSLPLQQEPTHGITAFWTRAFQKARIPLVDLNKDIATEISINGLTSDDIGALLRNDRLLVRPLVPEVVTTWQTYFQTANNGWNFANPLLLARIGSSDNKKFHILSGMGSVTIARIAIAYTG
jgi:hypothetical protein